MKTPVAALIGIALLAVACGGSKAPSSTPTATPSPDVADSAAASPPYDGCRLLSDTEVATAVTLPAMEVKEQPATARSGDWITSCTWSGDAPQAPPPADITPCTGGGPGTITLTVRSIAKHSLPQFDYGSALDTLTLMDGSRIYTYKGFPVEDVPEVIGRTVAGYRVSRAEFGFLGAQALSSRGCRGRGAEAQLNVVVMQPAPDDAVLLRFEIESWSGGNVLDDHDRMRSALMSLADLTLSRVGSPRD